MRTISTQAFFAYTRLLVFENYTSMIEKKLIVAGTVNVYSNLKSLILLRWTDLN